MSNPSSVMDISFNVQQGAIFESSSSTKRRYQVQKAIGSGGFGTIYQVMRNDSKLFAMKMIKPRGGYKMFQKELDVLYRPSHPHIIKLEDLAGPGSGRHLIMELADGTLDDLCNSISSRSYETAAQAVAHQLLDALAYIHSQGIIHRDIKPPNILVFRGDRSVVFKLADFGIAAMLVNDASMSFVGTHSWLAPENHAGQSTRAFEDRVDIYPLGRVLRNILLNTLSAPKTRLNLENVSAGARGLIRWALQHEACDRPAASTLQGYSWVQEGKRAARELYTQVYYHPPLPNLAHRLRSTGSIASNLRRMNDMGVLNSGEDQALSGASRDPTSTDTSGYSHNGLFHSSSSASCRDQESSQTSFPTSYSQSDGPSFPNLPPELRALIPDSWTDFPNLPSGDDFIRFGRIPNEHAFRQYFNNRRS